MTISKTPHRLRSIALLATAIVAVSGPVQAQAQCTSSDATAPCFAENEIDSSNHSENACALTQTIIKAGTWLPLCLSIGSCSTTTI